MTGVSVSRLAQCLDEQVEAFRQRPLEGRYPYLWLAPRRRRSATAAGCGVSAW